MAHDPLDVRQLDTTSHDEAVSDGESEFTPHEDGAAGLVAAQGVVCLRNVTIDAIFLGDDSKGDLWRDGIENAWRTVS